mmetsp:Transcript_219/g.437  ORF Transcript_219/g.437 Transcript_219/m.437 type:complete len:705 (-) Transcript_219:166-2280(-)
MVTAVGGAEYGIMDQAGQSLYTAVSQEPDQDSPSALTALRPQQAASGNSSLPSKPQGLLAGALPWAPLPRPLAVAAAALLLVGGAVAAGAWRRFGLRSAARLGSSLRAEGRIEFWARAARFQTISTGTCDDRGLRPVLDEATCEVAAQGLGLLQSSVETTPDVDRPEGCYFLKSAGGETLWLSTNPANRGNGASGIVGYSRNPICMQEIPTPVPTPAPVPHGVGPRGVAPAQTPTTASAPSSSARQEPISPTTGKTTWTMPTTWTTTKTTTSMGTTTGTTTRTTTGTSGTTSTTTPDPFAFKAPSKKPLMMSCLKFKEDGCYMIKDRDECVKSRDGRTALTWEGRKIHGQPCVWCGGKTCNPAGPSVCEPYDWVVKGSSFNASLARRSYEVAACPEMKGQHIPTLFCFSLMLPHGYEPGLLRAQLEKGVGIFNCEEFVVFSNRTVLLSHEGEKKVMTLPVPGDLELSVKYGGKWSTALNTDIFIRVWNAISLLGRYQYHDWTVKVDPDTVFFPSRLKELLMHQPMRLAPGLPGNHSLRVGCGHCKLPNRTNLTCAAHIQAMQQKGKTCPDALVAAAKSPPHDCGCDCGDLACNVSSTAMYLNNCKWGLHGPIEVISREAVATYMANIDSCEHIRELPFGEDKYLRLCLESLGVRRVDQFSILREEACGEVPAPCTAPNVAFHPFKNVQGYFDCWSHAKSLGQWP